jgi:WXG100 family type VII secretion target
MSDIDKLKTLSGQLRQGAQQFTGAANTLSQQAQRLDWSAQDLATGVNAWAGQGSQNFTTAWNTYHQSTQKSVTALNNTSQALTKLANKIDDAVQQMQQQQASQSGLAIGLGVLTVGLVVVDVLQLGLDPATDAVTVAAGSADAAAVGGSEAAAGAAEGAADGLVEADSEIAGELDEIVDSIDDVSDSGDLGPNGGGDPTGIQFDNDPFEEPGGGSGGGGDGGDGGDGGGDGGSGGDGGDGGDDGGDDGLENDPEVQSQGKAEVQQIREENNLTSNRQMNRNIATSNYDIDGETGEMKAISGPEKEGFVDGPGEGENHFDPPGTGENPRTADTEYKILEKIADDYWSDDPAERAQVSGEIRLYSERIPCTSCQDIISQFEEAFPNIRIIVGWGG